MTKREVHEIFKDFIVTVRSGKAIIMLGYKDGSVNNGFLPFDCQRKEKAVEICERFGIRYTINEKTEYGHRAVRIYAIL